MTSDAAISAGASQTDATASRPGKPCAPTVVVTSGRPSRIASTTLRFTPAPCRSGTIATRALAYHWRSSASLTSATIFTSRPASARTRTVGWDPTIASRASGTCRRTRGRMTRTSQQAASSFGGCAKPATNNSNGVGTGRRGCATSAKPYGCTACATMPGSNATTRSASACDGYITASAARHTRRSRSSIRSAARANVASRSQTACWRMRS